MARRILSADTALRPLAQVSLQNSRPAASREILWQAIQDHWSQALPAQEDHLIFDWNDRQALMAEIDFVNRSQIALDEAAVKIAPSLLRIVLTVKRHVPNPKEQRAFLADHLELDFRRISELCIVADSYGLLDNSRRRDGEREIDRYGWSKALKLAYVRDPLERQGIWERARGNKRAASYRAVLEEIRRFRERKLIASPPPQTDIASRLDSIREKITAIHAVAGQLTTREDFQEALQGLQQLSRDLSQIKRALKEQMVAAEMEELAASA